MRSFQFESYGRGVAMLKKPDGTQWWVDVAGYIGDRTPEATGKYILTIVQQAGMEQMITAKFMGDVLKKTAQTVLYIQFETG